MTDPVPALTEALRDRYRIERELGQGGMAMVYLAHDVKHDRRVALKVLRPELAAVIGAERFLQEIKTTANLQHPHILPLHDSGQVDGTVFYVMPYVEGETIRDRLDREGQLPVNDAVKLAREVAGALDYAHRQGVVHRDIKPENILLHEGQALVADFGIALAVSRSDGATRMTETGLSLGTPHYMSPEQAMGERTVDARTDIYALGCVLYETLTGEPPFTGPSAQAIVARVLSATPDSVTTLRNTVPAHVAAAIHTAIQKLPADRFPTAAAFAEALGNTGYTTATAVPGAAAAGKGLRHNRPALALGGLAAVAIAVALWGWFRPEPQAEPVLLDLALGGITLTNSGEVIISPDGSMLAVGGIRDGQEAIWLRRIGEPDFQKVLGTDNGQRPSFSPDNQWIVFRRNSDNSLVKVAVTGGGAMTLVGSGDINPFESHWGTDEWIVFGSPQGVHRVPASGGPVELLAGAGGRQPLLLPDGSGVLHTLNGDVSVLDFSTDSSTVLVPEARHPVYVATGHLLYIAEDGGLFAVPFDLGAHRVTGPAVRVLDRVAGTNARRGYSVSRNGTLVHYEGEVGNFTGGTGAPTAFVLMDLSGKGDTIPLPPGRRLSPRFSPDGRTVAYEFVAPARNGPTDIYTFDLVTGTNAQITFDGDNDNPIWSPDGKRIVWDRDTAPNMEDLFVKLADNSGPMELMLAMPAHQNATGWLEDGTVLLESFGGGQSSSDLLVYSPDEKGAAKVWLNAPWDEFELAVSPDRTLAAHVGDETNDEEVWLRTWPVPEGKWRVSFGGNAYSPRWSPDSRYIYFWQIETPTSTLFRARVDRTPSIVVRAPERVLSLALDGDSGWDLHPDGERFIATVPGPVVSGAAGPAAAESRYLVVLNWFTELKALTSRGRQ